MNILQTLTVACKETINCIPFLAGNSNQDNYEYQDDEHSQEMTNTKHHVTHQYERQGLKTTDDEDHLEQHQQQQQSSSQNQNIFENQRNGFDMIDNEDNNDEDDEDEEDGDTQFDDWTKTDNKETNIQNNQPKQQQQKQQQITNIDENKLYNKKQEKEEEEEIDDSDIFGDIDNQNTISQNKKEETVKNETKDQDQFKLQADDEDMDNNWFGEDDAEIQL